MADAAIPLAALVRDPSERVARFAARLLLNRRRPDWRERAAAPCPTAPTCPCAARRADPLRPRERHAGEDPLRRPTGHPRL